MSYIGKERFRDERYAWIIEDAKPAFPHLIKSGFSGKNKFATLYLSRRRYPKDIFDGMMSDKNRVALLCDKGLSAAIIKKLPSEKSIVSTLARMVHGLQDFTIRS